MNPYSIPFYLIRILPIKVGAIKMINTEVQLSQDPVSLRQRLNPRRRAATISLFHSDMIWRKRPRAANEEEEA